MMKNSFYPKSIIALTIGFTFITSSGLVSAVSCGDVITTAEVLDADISNCAADPAITIIGPEGSLDLNGYEMSCDGMAGVGILLDGSFANLTNSQPQTGIITSCETGISIEGSGFHNISSVTAIENAITGVRIVSNNNFLSGSNYTFNLSIGIEVLGNENFLNLLNVTSNADGGINIFGDNTLISLSNASNNGGAGIDIRDVDGSQIIQNSANANDQFGIRVRNFDQVNTLITGNVAQTNNNNDLVDNNNPACTGTTWFGNQFTSSNNSCIE
ncbi:right-handed parallel beta-helix repeat-containing protein [Microbulbifer sp. ANSA003]|uniref:right-handed parallel beta-helix repeat-containing protein n=1 Tax=Microbulbifer sp. ANSA003 TaxID=3243360 RepID=UPI0040431070